MKILIVGDLHVKRSNLEETKPLLTRIVNMAPGHDVVIHLGDLYNDHGVVTADVQTVITDFFSQLSELSNQRGCGVIIKNLEGNHDQDGDGKHTSLYVHDKFPNKTGIQHIMKPTSFVTLPFAMIPYIRDPKKFEDAVYKLLNTDPELKLVFCHQEFNGAIYENGLYAPHGVDSSLFPNIQFISGHIHKGQEFGNVWYPGAPRWLTKSDANDQRGIWSIELGPEGMNRAFHSSEDICPAFFNIILTEEQIKSGNLPKAKKGDKVYVEYIGDNPDSIKQIQFTYENLSLKNKKVWPIKAAHVSESKGIISSVRDYVMSLDTSFPKEELLSEVMRRISV